MWYDIYTKGKLYKMKNLVKEFKKFISRGSVMDLAVGTIIGAAFTSIVTALSNGILKPLINWVIYLCAGGNTEALTKMYTVLVPVTEEVDGVTTLDLTKSIYIDWGAFISAIINFLLIAVVLFFIVKAFNKAKDAKETMKNTALRAKEKQEKGLPLTKKEKAALEEIAAADAEKAAADEAAAQAAKALAEKEEALVNAQLETAKLLKDIKELLAKK